MEAGPAYVLAAFWQYILRETKKVLEDLSMVAMYATALPGVGPRDVKTAWPSVAYMEEQPRYKDGPVHLGYRAIEGKK